jgi:hypothetical protein
MRVGRGVGATPTVWLKKNLGPGEVVKKCGIENPIRDRKTLTSLAL